MEKLKNNMIEVIESMQQRLALLQPSFINIIDESHLHIGHPGRDPGKGHFRLQIRSQKLIHLSRVQQHQKIYMLLGDLMQSSIHALAIEIVN